MVFECAGVYHRGIITVRLGRLDSGAVLPQPTEIETMKLRPNKP